MDLKDKIKELEHKLAIKQAYLSLSFTFPRGNKIPQDIKDLIVHNLKEYATKLANDEESNINVNTVEEEFSVEERKILKDIVARVLEKQKTPDQEKIEVTKEGTLTVTKIKTEVKKLTPEEKFDAAPKKASIITVDNIDASVKSKVDRTQEVRIIGSDSKMYCVQDRKGIQFWIPKDDVEI